MPLYFLRGTQGAGNDKTGRHYTGCQIYYYKNGKVVKMDTFKDRRQMAFTFKKRWTELPYKRWFRFLYPNLC